MEEEIKVVINELRTWTTDQLYKSMPNADPSALAKLISGSIADKLQSILDTKMGKNSMVYAWNTLVEGCDGVAGNCDECPIRSVCPSEDYLNFVDFDEAGRVKENSNDQG